MKKSYVPLALIVILLIFMSTGSLAIYTQSQTLRGQLYTRVFLFGASEEGTSYDLGLSGLALAPTDGARDSERSGLTAWLTMGKPLWIAGMASCRTAGLIVSRLGIRLSTLSQENG